MSVLLERLLEIYLFVRKPPALTRSNVLDRVGIKGHEIRARSSQNQGWENKRNSEEKLRVWDVHPNGSMETGSSIY